MIRDSGYTVKIQVDYQDQVARAVMVHDKEPGEVVIGTIKLSLVARLPAVFEEWKKWVSLAMTAMISSTHGVPAEAIQTHVFKPHELN